jgi:hypothetical protein
MPVCPNDDMQCTELTPERAFVLQLHKDSALDAATLHGRIEHVISGKAVDFGSLLEAFAFMQRVLADGQPE